MLAKGQSWKIKMFFEIISKLFGFHIIDFVGSGEAGVSGLSVVKWSRSKVSNWLPQDNLKYQL